MESVENQVKDDHDCPVCRAQKEQSKSAREQAEKALNTDRGKVL